MQFFGELMVLSANLHLRKGDLPPHRQGLQLHK